VIQFPSIVSRTLATSERSLVSVFGIHDKRLTDADFNLSQSLQDEKRYRVLKNQTCSGALSYSPFTFNQNLANSFTIPAFDVLLGGEVITVGGNLSSDLKQNRVLLPVPTFWTPGFSTPDCSIYVVYLEMWFARLCPDAGNVQGYYQNPATGLLYYYPNGCINADISNLIPNDTIDPFQALKTTERVQLQWALRVSAVDPSYDFTQYNYGLDAGPNAETTVYAQANQPTASSGAPYQYVNMAAINGDAGVWRAGDGNTNNELNSMDGYAYAMPVAVVFQRNTGTFQVSTNPFGCASATNPLSGLLSYAASGRYDSKFADVIYPEDVVDTRSTVALEGHDDLQLMSQGFVDIISGQASTAIGRGQAPGNKPEALGSRLGYYIGVGPTTVANVANVGQFDGFINGFGSAAHKVSINLAVSTASKSVGAVGSAWVKGDAFVLSLPTASLATISSVQVQALVGNTVTSTKSPALLLQGQVNITGIGTKTVTVSIAQNLTGTAFDPGLNNIYALIDVQYPAETGMDLRVIPNAVYGGQLLDTSSGKTLPVYGVSEYEVQASQPALSAYALWTINTEFSNLVFGTRAWITAPASAGTQTTVAGVTTTSFTFTRTGLNGSLTGMYTPKVWDQTTGNQYVITGRSISDTTYTVTVQGVVAAGSTLVASFLCVDTAQLVYNAPTKAISAIEETILAGNATDPTFHMDSRVQVVSLKNTLTENTIVLAASGVILRAISGDDINRLIWVQDTSGAYVAVPIGSTTFQNGLVTLVVPPTVNLQVQPFFVVAAIYPAFTPTSTLILEESYIPYQGEGQLNAEYEVLTTEDVARITTNGTGAAPVPGLSDVYPYNRELPVSTTLPALSGWTDSSLANTAVASFFDSNYEAMRQENVEHTFDVPVHTNDFIEPVGGGQRNLQATTAPITLYVNNLTGSDANDGQTLTTPLASIQAALAILPPVLRHPCTIQLVATGVSYSVASLAPTLQIVPLGDGDVRSLKYYTIGNLSYSVQASGRLVISAQSGVSTRITIDASTFQGFGDGPTSAFFIENSRVIFNQIAFVGFRDAAVKGIDALVDFVNCAFTNNLTAGSFEQGSTVILDGGTMQLSDGSTGFILSASDLTVSDAALAVAASTTPGTFFVAELGSSITFQESSQANETNVSSSTLIAEAELNSSIVCVAGFSSGGSASLSTNSVLQKTVDTNPFVGGVTTDASSNVTTSL
jgi:hypothetical protein